jgi:hypothetical protein
MDQKTSGLVLVILSVAYGITVGILGYFGSSVLVSFTVIGALVLGGLWVVRGLLANRERSG